MNLILIHGSFQDAVIKKEANIKKGFDPLSITEISGSGTSLDLSSPSLFSQKRLVILENPDLQIVETISKETDPDLTVVLKFSKALEKNSAILKKVAEGKGEILSFDETSQTSIFPLLDMLGNHNRKAFSEFEKNYNQMGGQYILTMLAYLLRRMVQNPKSSSFMQQKIETQKKNFSLEKITRLYQEIIETDFKIKQGLLEEKLGVTLLIKDFLGQRSIN